MNERESEFVEQDDYQFWWRALAGEKIGGDTLPVHDSDCQAGFWRKRVERGGAFIPVATWWHEGDIVAIVNGEPADARALWTHICRYPITEEQYHARMRGEPWFDEDPNVAASLQPPPAGHNRPPQDEAEIIKGQIEAASAGVSDYAEINDDETAAKAQSLRSRLLELSTEADGKREAEKKPFLEGGRLVDAKWQPLVKSAKEFADKIRIALGAHETRKEKARQAAEAERLRIEAAARKAQEAAIEAGKPPPPMPAPPPPAPEPKAPLRGAYGRAASVKTVKIAKVVDQDAAYGFLKTSPELVSLIAVLAQKAVKAGLTVPGVEVSEEKDVR